MNRESEENSYNSTEPDFGTSIDLKIQSILKPLSNVTRQQLLIILSQGPITYTEIYNKLNLESGSFYWHIKKMEMLVQQTEDKRYLLSDIGMKAYKLLYTEGDGYGNIETPNWVIGVTKFTDKLQTTPQWIILQQILLIFIITAIGFSSVNIVQIGTIPEVYKEVSFLLVLVSLVASSMLSSIFVTLIIIGHERTKSRKIGLKEIKNVFIQILFVNGFIFLPGLISALFILIAKDPNNGLQYILILPIIFISTIFVLLITMAVIISNFNYDHKTALLISLIGYYPYFVLSFSIQLFKIS